MSDFNFTIGRVGDTDPRIYFMPFGLIVNTDETNFPAIPVAENVIVNIPGVDGEIVKDTKYLNRVFSVVAVSYAGRTFEQREKIKRDLVFALDSTKDKYQNFVFTKAGIMFKVKYSGSAEILDEYNMIKVSIPFETQPYGTLVAPVAFHGNGMIDNKGHADIGFTATIGEGVVTPNFTVGDVEFKWDSTVPTGYSLVIDAVEDRCYLLGIDGSQINAMRYLSKGYLFTKISKTKSYAVTALNAETEANMLVQYNPMFLWKSDELY